MSRRMGGWRERREHVRRCRLDDGTGRSSERNYLVLNMRQHTVSRNYDVEMMPQGLFEFILHRTNLK